MSISFNAGRVGFSNDPLMYLGRTNLPDCISSTQNRFQLPALSHAAILGRSEEKPISFLKFLADGEKFTTKHAASFIWELAERQTQASLSSMINQGLLVVEKVGDRHLFGITSAGANYILPTETFRTFALGKTSNTTLLHRLLIQQVRVVLKFYGIDEWETDRQIVAYRKPPNIPDSQFYIHDLIFAVELELTLKALNDQRSVLETYSDNICKIPDPGAWFNRVIFFTPHVSQIAERINKFVPEKFRKLFFVQYINPVLQMYDRRLVFENEAFANFIGTRY